VRWHTALRLGRISNLPTVWSNVTAASVLAGAVVPSGGILGLALACSCFYVGGMFLNDAFDREHDARVRPDRPIPAGAAAASEVLIVGFGLLAAGLVSTAAIARAVRPDAVGEAIASAAALAGAILLYDVWHKDNPMAPLLMGLCRVLVYVTTAATLTAALPGAVVVGAAVILAYLILLTAVARHPVLGARSWLVAVLIAGIALVDGAATALAGRPDLALACVGAFGLTLVLQRWVAGT
jgi:4-hydroxybenzoate polyprenyltransferase